MRGQSYCLNNLQWHGWSEDLFVSVCMVLLGVDRVYDFNLTSDGFCFTAPCSDQSKVVLHPFKSEQSWWS